MNNNTISQICIPWLHNPYQHPVTKSTIKPGSIEHNDMTKLCADIINFDLLGLINDPEKCSISVSPIVSFLSAAFISDYTGEFIHHPYKNGYSASTTTESNILDNFDFGFIWHKSNKTGKWSLVPPKGMNKLKGSVKKMQMVLVSILDDRGVTVNILFYDTKGHSWERFSPLGANEYDTSLDQALIVYFSKPYQTAIRGETNYYTPVSCPISTTEMKGPQRQLYCSLWSLWFLLYRIKNSGMSRESQYTGAVAGALANSDEFNQFIINYVTFINDNKRRIISTGQALVLDHEMDDFLAEQIFSLF